MKILRNKTIRESVYRIAANYIIAKDALYKAHDADKMSIKQYGDAIQYLTDNTINTVSAIGGLKGLILLNDILKNKIELETLRIKED